MAKNKTDTEFPIPSAYNNASLPIQTDPILKNSVERELRNISKGFEFHEELIEFIAKHVVTLYENANSGNASVKNQARNELNKILKR